jgi:hypothetical protein
MSGHFLTGGVWEFLDGKKIIFLGLIQSAMVDQANGKPSFSLPGPRVKHP